MDADCQRLIDAVLSRLRSGQSPDGRAWPSAEAELVRLPERCGATLLAHARQLLDALPDSAEAELSIVLSAATRRGADASGVLKSLLEDAIRSRHTVLKEYFADMVAELFGDIEAIDVLQRLLDEADRPDLVPVIEALASLRATSSAAAIRRYVDSDDRVLRSTAIGFLYNYDTPDAAPHFLRQLPGETDPDLIEALVDGLVSWKCTEALPLLRTMETHAETDRLHRVIRAAIEDLS